MKDKKNQHEDTRFSSSEQGKRVLKNFRQQFKVALFDRNRWHGLTEIANCSIF